MGGAGEGSPRGARGRGGGEGCGGKREAPRGFARGTGSGRGCRRVRWGFPRGRAGGSTGRRAGGWLVGRGAWGATRGAPRRGRAGDGERWGTRGVPRGARGVLHGGARGVGVSGSGRARIAGRGFEASASARRSCGRPTRRGLATSPTSTTCSASRSGWVPRARRRGEAVGVQRGPGRAWRPRAWAGRRRAGRGAGRAQAAPGQAWHGGERGVRREREPAALPRSRDGWLGDGQVGSAGGGGGGGSPAEWLQVRVQASFTCLGGCWRVPRR